MNPEELQSHVASGRLTQVQVNKLGNLSPGSFCLHRSWGFGKIDSIDPILGQIIINFQQKQKHPMQLAYAADSLTPIGIRSRQPQNDGGPGSRGTREAFCE
jgi:hypothetical protein